MKKMKKFLTYALIVAAFWIFSDIIGNIAIKGTYKTIGAKIYISSPQVTITENKATYVNGVVKGNIRNNTQDILNDIYLKLDMYSERDVHLGTKYVKIENLPVNATQDFEMWYEFTDVNYINITTTTEAQNIQPDELLSQRVALYFIIGKIIFWSLI